MGSFRKLTHSRFLRFFITGSVIEAVRMILFTVLLSGASIWESNLYSLIVSVLVSFPIFGWFVWPDRPGSRRAQLVKFLLVSLVAIFIKLPLLEYLLLPCPYFQRTVDVWVFGSPVTGLPLFGFFYGLLGSCVNWVTAAMDLVVAVGLKYFFFDRFVFLVLRSARNKGS